MKLIIVESPTKCHTFSRYLGDDYKILASKGHICDLATTGKGGLGVDVEHDFEPKYTITKGKSDVVKELKKAAKEADEVILATDPDREGEAIGWHLANTLKLDVSNTKRLIFHEITRVSIENAIENPSTLDMNLVSSQETRRIIDRIIGFKLSGLLQKKIQSRSGGRVQSATLKLICDHEKEIQEFKPEEYWTVDVDVKDDEKNLKLALTKVDGKACKIKNEQEALTIVEKIPSSLVVSNVKKSLRSRESKDPFTTSTLQQEAFNKFGYKTKDTAKLAQKLYEGLPIGNGEVVGLITYIRTDSSQLSKTFIDRATSYIEETYGKEYVGHAKVKKHALLAQDAHEAIRPTGNHRTPESVRPYLKDDRLYNLYKLIYTRTLASLMPAKKEEVTTVSFEANGLLFSIDGVVTVFDGYEKVYSDSPKDTKALPVINEGEVFKVTNIDKKQNYTKAPARYSEARIVKLMEEDGIGRPSTYASTINTLLERKYVVSEKGILTPTEQGMKTSDFLSLYFVDLVSTKYTAEMENDLDKVQEGEETRLDILNEFYSPFIEKIEEVKEKIKGDNKEIVPNEFCPVCGSPLAVIKGKYGSFIGCSDYPNCKYKKPKEKKELVEVGRMCPTCGSPLVERKDRKGKTFIGCSNFPKCHYTESIAGSAPQEPKFQPEETEEICPKCGHKLIKRKGKYGFFLGCSNFPKCRYIKKL